MADWKAAFASLQLKQAHEVAEFALARRREDELRIETQAREIDELRRALEASRQEADQVKANCVMVTEEKLKFEEEYIHQLHVSESFRENVNELNEAQQQMSRENMELKRALDEAVVTTGRLKVALEEKAAELVAWLGHEGLATQILDPVDSESGISPEAQEKKAYTVQALSNLSSGEDSKLGAVAGNQTSDGMATDNISKVQDVRLTSATEKLIIGLEEELEDMKHEVLAGISENAESRAHVRNSRLSLKDPSGIEFEGDGRALDNLSSKEKKVVVNLRRRISELQVELERLRSLESVLYEQQTSKSIEEWDVKKSPFQASTPVEIGDRQETISRGSMSRSTSMKSEIIEGRKSNLIASTSEEFSTVVDSGDDQWVGQSRVLYSDVIPAVANDPIEPQMNDLEFGEPSVSAKCSEATSVGSRVDLEDKFVCVSRSQPWSVVTISKLVECITEELTKLLSVFAKAHNASSQNTFTDLETRVKLWSNVTTKTLQSNVSRNGAIEEWKDLVVDFLGQIRQELMAIQQRLHDCESELSLMDKLQAEGLAASQNVSLLEDEIQRLEAQSFNDQIEREEEVNLLKEELELAKRGIAEAQKRATDDKKITASLREQLRKSEIELENSKLGWAAEQDFINSCFGDGKEEISSEDKVVSRKEMGKMEKSMEELMCRLEENERELEELLIISAVDPDSVVSAKLRRLEQRLEDAKASETILEAERAELASNVTWLKAKLAEVEHELQLENQQHVEMLIRYEEEQDHLESSTKSETGNTSAKLLHMEQLLAEKAFELDIAQGGKGKCVSQAQILDLREKVLSLENILLATKQNAVDSELTLKTQINREKDKYASLESRFINLQSNFSALKTQLSETEQREKRGQSKIEKLMVELGIAKEEVLKYEVRLQKTLRQGKEDVEAEKRKHEGTVSSQKQMEWHLCRQIELTEGLEREKAKLREVLVEFELQNLALQKETDNLRNAYMHLARQVEQRNG